MEGMVMEIEDLLVVTPMAVEASPSGK